MSYAPTNEYNKGYAAPATGPQYTPQHTNSTAGTVYAAPQTQHGAETTYQQQAPMTATMSTHSGPPEPWRNGFWSCCTPAGTCCMATWCPCILYGKTRHRLTDPTLARHSACNGSCMGWSALMCCGLQWIMSTMHRGEIRKQYHLQGSGCGDCMRAFCCPCCELIQEEKEVIYRNQLGSGAGYQKVEGMKV